MKSHKKKSKQGHLKKEAVHASPAAALPVKENPKSRLYHVRGALGDADLLAEHNATLKRLVTGDYAPADLERLKGSEEIFSLRLNKEKRLLFTLTKVHGEDCLVLLDYLPTHDYHKSRFLRHGVLQHHLERHKELFDALAEDESVFEPVSVEEFQAKFAPCSAALEDDDSVVLEYYHQNLLELNPSQKKALEIALPAVIGGVAGSGKSCVALSLLSSYLLSLPPEAQERVRLVYVSQSDLLVKNMQQAWQEQPAALQKGQVEFKTYQQLLQEQELQAANIATFEAWYANYSAHAKKVARLKEEELPELSSQAAYQECRIRSGYLPEEYLKLGTKQSQLDLNKRFWINKVYADYLEYLQSIKHYAPEFTPLPQQETYDLVIVDEAQDFSHLQLNSLSAVAKKRAIAYCLDSHQRLFDALSVRPYLLQKLNIAESSHLELNMMYRCPPKILAVANEVIALKHFLVGGIADKNEPTQVNEASHADDSQGHFYLLDQDMLDKCAWMREQPLGTQFAVVTLAPYREEAKKYFNTPLVFTPEEIKGLEYDVVAAYKLYPPELFKEARKRFDSRQGAKQPMYQAKAETKDEHYIPAFNSIYTAYTRARKALIVCEPPTKGNEVLLGRLRPLADKGLPSSEGLQQSNQSNWRQEAAKQRAAGNHAVARAIEEERKFPEAAEEQKVPEVLEQQERKIAEVEPKNKTNKKNRRTVAAPSAFFPPAKAAEKTAEEIQAIALYKNFNEKRLNLALRNLDIEKLLLKKYQEEETSFILLDHLIQENKMDELICCVVDDLALFCKMPCKKLLAYCKKNKSGAYQKFCSQLSEIVTIQQEFAKNIGSNLQHSLDQGATPVCVSTFFDDAKSLQVLKRLGADLAKTLKMGATPAYIAAQRGNVEILKLLKKWGVNLEIAANNGVTPAYIAAQNGEVEVLKLLKKWGVNLEVLATGGATPACIATQERQVEVLKLFKEWGVNLETPKNDGQSPAYIATKNGDVDVLKLFKEAGVNLEAASTDGITPAYVAAFLGHVEVLKLFKKWNVNLEIPAKNGTTPVYVAAQEGHVAVLELFKKWGVNLEVPAKNGTTPVYVAAQQGHVAILELFKKWGVNLETSASIGVTLAYAAAENGHVAVLKLCKEWGINLGESSKEGVTPMLIAAKNGHLEVIKYLLEMKQMATTPCTLSKELLLNLSKDQDDKTGEIIRRLQNKIEERLQQGDNESAIKLLPLDVAWIMGHKDIVELLGAVRDNGPLPSARTPKQRRDSTFQFFSGDEKEDEQTQDPTLLATF